jgi:hypothetical protein
MQAQYNRVVKAYPNAQPHRRWFAKSVSQECPPNTNAALADAKTAIRRVRRALNLKESKWGEWACGFLTARTWNYHKDTIVAGKKKKSRTSKASVGLIENRLAVVRGLAVRGDIQTLALEFFARLVY